MKKLIAVALILVLAVGASGCFAWGVNLDGAEIAKEVAGGINEYQSNKNEWGTSGVVEQSFSTPEEAIESFIAGIRENDLYMALSACAINDYAEDFDFEAQAERLGVIMPMTGMAPSESDLYEDINKITQTNYLCNQIKMFCYSFGLGADVDMAGTTQITDAQEAEAFADAVDPERLERLEIASIDEPSPDLLYSEANQRNFDTQAQIHGADEQTERVVLYDLDGTLYGGGFQLLRYGKAWKVSAMTSNLAGMSPYGAVVPITEKEYRQITE